MSKKSWDSFERLYAKVETVDPDTGKKKIRYHYQGSWHVLVSEPGILRVSKWICLTAMLLGVLCLIWAGTRVSEFNRMTWTALPVGLAAAVWIFIACGVLPLLFSGDSWKTPDHDRAESFLRTATLAEAGLMAFAFLYGTGWRWLGGHGEESVLPLLGYLGSAACALVIRRSFEKLEYRVERNAEQANTDPLAVFRREEEGE